MAFLLIYPIYTIGFAIGYSKTSLPARRTWLFFGRQNNALIVDLSETHLLTQIKNPINI